MMVKRRVAKVQNHKSYKHRQIRNIFIRRYGPSKRKFDQVLKLKPSIPIDCLLILQGVFRLDKIHSDGQGYRKEIKFLNG